MSEQAKSTLADWERAEIARANESDLTPVVFVHGLWLLSSSWQPWRDFFEDNAFITLAPGWPDDPATVAEAREHPEAFAKKMVQEVTDHYLEAIAELDQAPVVIGHSFGGLIAQKIAGEGVAAATVSIDNAPFKGVLPLPASALEVRVTGALQPRERQARGGAHVRAVPVRLGQRARRDRGTAPLRDLPRARGRRARSSRRPSRTSTRSAARRRSTPRIPSAARMLIIGGEKDHTVPPAITNASYRIQARNPSTTEEITIPGRGHSLTIDSGWREVADEALAFVQRFIQ